MFYEKPVIVDFGSITRYTFWGNDRVSPVDHEDDDDDDGDD